MACKTPPTAQVLSDLNASAKKEVQQTIRPTSQSLAEPHWKLEKRCPTTPTKAHHDGVRPQLNRKLQGLASVREPAANGKHLQW